MKENEEQEPTVTEAELARVAELDALWGSQDATMSQSWAAENELALLCPKIARELAAARAAMGKLKAILAQRDNSYFFDMLKEWEEDFLDPPTQHPHP